MLGTIPDDWVDAYIENMETFRKERKIESKEQWRVLQKQLNEELTELFEAETDDDRIDAIGDMIVFLFNCGGPYINPDLVYSTYRFYLKHRGADPVYYEKYKSRPYCRAMPLNDYVHEQYIEYITIFDKLIRGTAYDNMPYEQRYKPLSELIGLYLAVLEYYFHVYPHKVMDEIYKEISCRQQDPKQKILWDENPNIVEKWEKDKNQDPKTLYKANFTLVRIPEEKITHTEDNFVIEN